MKFQVHSVPSCCGQTSTILKLDQPITKELMEKFVIIGFNEQKTFSAAGIMNINNEAFYLIGTFGSNKLQVKCKHKDCAEKMKDFEVLLTNI